MNPRSESHQNPRITGTKLVQCVGHMSVRKSYNSFSSKLPKFVVNRYQSFVHVRVNRGEERIKIVCQLIRNTHLFAIGSCSTLNKNIRKDRMLDCIWVSNLNSVTRNCAQLCRIMRKCSRNARKSQGSQLRASKIHLRWKPYFKLTVETRL